MTDFPRRGEEITADWLTSRFISNGFISEGLVSSVEETRQPKADRTASNLSITYSENAEGVLPAKVFFKYNTNGREGVDEPRHCAAVREALFYSEFDSDGLIGPQCYDAGGDFDNGEVYLITPGYHRRLCVAGQGKCSFVLRGVGIV